VNVFRNGFANGKRTPTLHCLPIYT